jgi:carbonic anhydrase
MLDHLISQNRKWAASVVAQDPTFFSNLRAQQRPQYLWIGCSDSRVPANILLGLPPGEVFVHRNLANVVVHSDLNCLSVIQFAVDVLAVKHIIVCGHYGCSAVHAALTGQRTGLADNWIRHVHDVQKKHSLKLSDLCGNALRHDRLCELNAMEQALNVCRTSIVQDAWGRGQQLAVHCLMYGLHDGLLRHLGLTITSAAELSMHAESEG